MRGAILADVDALFLDEAAVTRLIDPPELLDVLADGFRLLSAGAVVAPKRIEVAAERGFSLACRPTALVVTSA